MSETPFAMVQNVEQAGTGAANEARRMVLELKEHAGASVATTAERESRSARRADLREANAATLGLHCLLGGKKPIGFDLVPERVLLHAGGITTSLGRPLSIIANGVIKRLFRHRRNCPPL
ncbi:hypothetical protein [Thalassoglobus sp.]|uniref:hypothetical protein n=1 Tax=Thalassoglobus sp. TaxID=2795869 RepID=UPI003AA7FCF0